MNFFDFSEGATSIEKKGFYVGDPCFAMKKDIYDDVWGKLYKFQDGCFCHDGVLVAIHSTKYGGGEYKSSPNEFIFYVDSGSIGIIPLELCDEEKLKKVKEQKYGMIFENTTSARLQYDEEQGLFKITIEDVENELGVICKYYFYIPTYKGEC